MSLETPQDVDSSSVYNRTVLSLLGDSRVFLAHVRVYL